MKCLNIQQIVRTAGTLGGSVLVLDSIMATTEPPPTGPRQNNTNQRNRGTIEVLKDTFIGMQKISSVG